MPPDDTEVRAMTTLTWLLENSGLQSPTAAEDYPR